METFLELKPAGKGPFSKFTFSKSFFCFCFVFIEITICGKIENFTRLQFFWHEILAFAKSQFFDVKL